MSMTIDELLDTLDNISLPRFEYIRISIYTDCSGTIYHVPYNGDDEVVAEFNNKNELIAAVKGVQEVYT